MDEVKKTKKVKVHRDVYEDKWLATIAVNQLSQAKSEGDGHRFRWVVPSMAFSVFRVEALCNIYGNQLFPHWGHFETSSFLGKVVMISEFLKIKVDFSTQPWQSLNEMKNFRNTLAHAKPKKISAIHEIPEHLPDRLAPFPKDKKTIMSYSSIESAERFIEVADELDWMWSSHSGQLGYNVDTIGAVSYTHLTLPTIYSV